MFTSINKTIGCWSKIFGWSPKNSFVVPNFVAVTKPFFFVMGLMLWTSLPSSCRRRVEQKSQKITLKLTVYKRKLLDISRWLLGIILNRALDEKGLSILRDSSIFRFTAIRISNRVAGPNRDPQPIGRGAAQWRPLPLLIWNVEFSTSRASPFVTKTKGSRDKPRRLT